MLPLEIAVTFVTASCLLSLAPGPDNIFVLTQSTKHGKSSGIMVMLGLCTGLLFHTTAVAFGVAMIIKTSTIAFSALKFMGAGYLLYLAWHSFRASSAKASSASSRMTNYLKLYVRGIIMNITNPKVSIFFLAFLPQFVDPERGTPSLQLLLLGGLFILSTLLIFGSIALLGGTIGRLLNRDNHFQSILNKIAGIVYLFLALTLVTAQI